jgi:hypothetical protein
MQGVCSAASGRSWTGSIHRVQKHMNAAVIPFNSPFARRFLAPVVSGGLSAGAIDLTYAFTYHGLHGIAPSRILQSIASGLLGMRAFDGGVSAALIGLIAHFLILLVAAALYCAASRHLKLLVRRALPCGMAFGAVIYTVMTFVVVPLSAAPHFRSSSVQVALDIAVHLLLLGPAIAFSAKYFDKPASAG